MKQILFLLLFPCLAMAQYTGNAGQKITLGEQTTADGLVWRGRLADTANLLTNKLDTSVYIVLDTGTRAMWYYRASTTPKWTRLVDSLNNMQGTLAVANGGTGATSLSPNNYLIRTNSSGVFDTAAIFEAGGNVGIGTTTPGYKLDVIGTGRFSGNEVPIRTENTGNTEIQLVRTSSTNGTGFGLYTGATQNWLFGTAWGETSSNFILYNSGTASQSFKVNYGTNQATFNSLAAAGVPRAVLADANGTLSASSSISIKENVQNINYGLDKILQLQPKSFQYIDKNKYSDGTDLGFIAEDVYTIIPEATGTMNDGFIYFDAVKLIPILTKAIQEQQTLIKALEQRILILENK